MTEATVPRRLTLATDLTARSDRATERAMMLASEFNAQLLVVHAVEADNYAFWDHGPSWRRSPNLVEVARRRLRLELPEMEALDIQVLVERGDPFELVRKASEGSGSELIVTGVAREEVYGASQPGRLVGELASHTGTPLLVVKRKPLAPYRHIVVAVELTENSVGALRFARRCFPNAILTVFHAVDLSYANLIGDLEGTRRSVEEGATKTCRQWLNDQLGPAEAEQLQLVVVYGEPAMLLDHYAWEKPVDLVVTGSHRRGAIARALLGSVARSVLERAPADVLIVPSS
ncbi:Nucleotide-binding universal stress protein, UspA family [Devosia enhydra]|uniref:Nucleotide-binding universal stress protein, UspA family n=1 Tax=Devosia enhydra TaxID=665118 RepID=A0A1K2HYB4_9HYPH|nr:universal stress protein [Devosia enhydra]SFZ84534.1 Nucleotide-binding universal stress protein, UspA family [Devosia enhydra]